jgi:hypothetical protein
MRTRSRGYLILTATVVALALPLALVVQAVYAEYPEDAEYVGHNQCKICHNKPSEGAQWQKWMEEGHSKAFETLQSDEAKAVAEELGMTTPPHEAAACLKCHVTGYDEASASAPAKIKLTEGVSCETCHGPGSMHIEDGKKVAFQKDASIDISAHVLRADAQLCQTCHNPESPTWDPERFTTESGEKVGFDFDKAWEMIDHSRPEE